MYPIGLSPARREWDLRNPVAGKTHREAVKEAAITQSFCLLPFLPFGVLQRPPAPMFQSLGCIWLPRQIFERPRLASGGALAFTCVLPCGHANFAELLLNAHVQEQLVLNKSMQLGRGANQPSKCPADMWSVRPHNPQIHLCLHLKVSKVLLPDLDVFLDTQDLLVRKLLPDFVRRLHRPLAGPVQQTKQMNAIE
jgi:hypothetical protein